MNPVLLAAVGCVGLALVVLSLARPRVALVVLVAGDISGVNGVVADLVGISPYRPLFALAALCLLVMAGRRLFRFRWSPVLLGVAVLYAGFCASLLGADDFGTSSALLAERARDLLYLLVVYALVLSTDSVRQVAQTAVLALAALAALTVVHEFVLHNQGDLLGLSRVPLVREGGAYTARHAGTSSDVNFWARLLVLVAPLSLSLWAAAGGAVVWSVRGIHRRVRPNLRWWLWLACSLSLALGVYLTQSRGGFIALFVGLVVWLVLAGRRYRRSLVLLGIALAVLVPLSGIGSRLGTLADVVSGSVTNADPSVATRKRLQLDALRMFQDSPVLGHGIGSYGSIFTEYDRLSNYTNPVDIVVAAHNLYLEQAADGGVVLLVAWSIFVCSVLFCALRARALALRASDRPRALLALGIVAGLVGWFAASVFLHMSDFRALLVFAALAAAMDVQAPADDGRPTTPPVWSPPTLLARTAVTGVGVLGLVGLIALAGAPAVRWTNEATLPVLPAGGETGGAAAYQLDVISRGLIVPTLAAAINATLTPEVLQREAARPITPDVKTVVGQSRLGGALAVTVTADDPGTAAAFGAAAVAVVERTIPVLDPHYATSPATVAASGGPSPVRWLALPLIVLVLGAGGTWLRWIRASRRLRPDAAPADEAAGGGRLGDLNRGNARGSRRL